MYEVIAQSRESESRRSEHLPSESGGTTSDEFERYGFTIINV